MENLYVKNDSAEYPIYIKNSFENLCEAFENAGLKGKKACIICDSNTERIFLDEIIEIANECFSEVSSVSFEAGENSKNLDTIKDLYAYFTIQRMDRKSVVIALGGGVTGDMAGFVAATFMRGVEFVQIPTTLLSQVDSSVGGKVGVDFMGNKNMIGAFYQPKFVYINTDTLNTLPPNEFAAGMAEAIKYGYIINSDYLEFVKENKESLKSLEPESLARLIFGACKAKAYVVSKDEKENGLREILNFGHTFGHAVESLSDFSLLHGECVAIGMMSALKLSAMRGYIDEEMITEARKLFEFFDLPFKAEGFEKEKIFKQMFYDKKTRDNNLNIVLLDKIGHAYTEKTVSDEEVLEAVEFILS